MLQVLSFFEDFSILTRESNDFKLKIMERLLIAHDKPVLNKVDSSLSLELFWYNISVYHMVFYHIMLIYHIMPIYPIVHIQLSFVQFTILCYKF